MACEENHRFSKASVCQVAATRQVRSDKMTCITQSGFNCCCISVSV